MNTRHFDSSCSIHLILQYYRSDNTDRQQELDTCLQQNLENRHIGRVHLLTEEAFDFSRFLCAYKIVQEVIGERLTYERAFRYAGLHDSGNIWILANADVYFDDTLAFLNDRDMTGRVFALTRHDVQKDGSLVMIPPVYGQGTQDAWIFRPPVSVEKMSADFLLGVPGCDSRIAHEFAAAGYRVTNPSKRIILRHLDLTREIDPLKRASEYRSRDTRENRAAGRVVPPPYRYVFPTSSLDDSPLWETAKKYGEISRDLLRRRPMQKSDHGRDAGGHENIYASGRYIENNPTLDVEDAPWKISKLLPLVDLFLQRSPSVTVRVLDVGGGAGIYLKEISDHLRSCGRVVEKTALDMSEEMLRMQQEKNLDLRATHGGSIEQTAFRERQFDLALMIDVLEHVPDAGAAVRELARIADFVIYKVPLERNLYYNLLNLLKRGKLRRDIFRKVGHINFFSYAGLRRLLLAGGNIEACAFTNVFAYYLSKEYHRPISLPERVLYTAARQVYRLSPEVCAILFPDSVACLVRCG